MYTLGIHNTVERKSYIKSKGAIFLENKWYFKIILYILTYMSTEINKLATTVYVQYTYSKLLELTCLGNHAPLDLYTVQM